MAGKDPRLSHQTLQVLRLLLEHPRGNLAGTDILKRTGILSGTLYPILLRLERAGWVESEWETLDARDAGRPRRRFYRLTNIGHNRANNALTQLGLNINNIMHENAGAVSEERARSYQSSLMEIRQAIERLDIPANRRAPRDS